MRYLLIDTAEVGKTFNPLLLRLDDLGRYWDITVFIADSTRWTLVVDRSYNYEYSRRIIEPLPLEPFLEAFDSLLWTKEFKEARQFLINEV